MPPKRPRPTTEPAKQGRGGKPYRRIYHIRDGALTIWQLARTVLFNFINYLNLDPADGFGYTFGQDRRDDDAAGHPAQTAFFFARP